MAWGEPITKEKRAKGRPLVNPFPSEEVEQEFYQTAKLMVSRYYDASDENTKKPFVFSPNVHMGKTTFWALIITYYTFRKQVAQNLLYILTHLATHVGAERVGDRASINALTHQYSAQKIAAHHLYDADDLNLSKAEAQKRQKNVEQYEFVVRVWEKGKGQSVSE